MEFLYESVMVMDGEDMGLFAAVGVSINRIGHIKIPFLNKAQSLSEDFIALK